MHDPWTDRLSEYIDGELEPAHRRELEAHLASCDACTATVAELQTVVAAAHTRHDPPPATDLWPGIADRIGAAPAGTRVLPATGRRRFTFSMPQLAAAAVLLVALSAAGAWYIAVGTGGGAPAPGAGTIVHSAGTAPAARLVDAAPAPSVDPDFDRTIAELEQALDEQRAALDPATVDVIERSMASIDEAIREARAALDADPGNAWLHRQLDTSMRKKLDVLRRAQNIRRVGA